MFYSRSSQWRETADSSVTSNARSNHKTPLESIISPPSRFGTMFLTMSLFKHRCTRFHSVHHMITPLGTLRRESLKRIVETLSTWCTVIPATKQLQPPYKIAATTTSRTEHSVRLSPLPPRFCSFAYLPSRTAETHSADRKRISKNPLKARSTQTGSRCDRLHGLTVGRGNPNRTAI